MLLESLETFARVVEAGSFTRAAQALDLSQPAVTKQITRLERDLGTPLLVRRPGRLELTPAGEVAFAYARRLLGDAARLRGEVAAVARPGWGSLALAGVDTVILFALPPILGRYRQKFPGVRLRVRTGSIRDVVDLLDHAEADVGLVTTPVSHARITSMPLFWDRVCVVAAPSRARELPRPLPRHVLSDTPSITYQSRSRFRAFVDAALAEHGVALNVQMEFDTHEAVRTMAALGFGVALVPESAVADDLAAGRLERLEVEGLPEIGRTTSLLVRRGDPPAAAAQAFIDMVAERYPGARTGAADGGGDA
jgi:DNA-binding transcriptional LysR family regulator